MKPKISEKKYLLPLLLIIIILYISVTISLTQFLKSSAKTQLKQVSVLMTEILTYKLKSFVDLSPKDSDNLFMDSKLLKKIEPIIRNYYQHEKMNFEGSELLIESSIDIKKNFKSSIAGKRNIHLIHKDGIVVSSSDLAYNNTFLSLLEPTNNYRLKEFLNGKDEDKNQLVLFENRYDELFDFYTVIPVRSIMELDDNRNFFIIITFENLDINQELFIDENIDTLLFFRTKGEVIFSYPYKSASNTNKLKNNKKISTLLKNREGIKLITTPYKNENNKYVVGVSLWIKKLSMGVVFELSAESLIKPFNILITLILITVFISFTIFSIIVILLNKKRIIAFDHNPLTHLPGNRTIMNKIKSSLKMKSDLMVIYCDLDNFKAYNDVYGFSKGDEIIHFSSEQLIKYFKPSKKTFLGHIGGDDFIVIGPTSELIERANEFGRSFDEEVISFYNELDRTRGYIESKNRNDDIQNFPFISMSMGGVKIKYHSNKHPLKITEICAEIKKEAKKISGSILYVDKRQS